MIRIVVNEAPVKELAENAKRTKHWSVRNGFTGPLRASAKNEALAQLPRGHQPIEGNLALRILIAWERGRNYQDIDSALIACKPILDGFTDAEVWLDDSQVQEVSILQALTDWPVGKVYIDIVGARYSAEWLSGIGGEISPVWIEDHIGHAAYEPDK